jgi:hypothetical protein
VGQAFHSDDVSAIELKHKLNAGIDGNIAKPLAIGASAQYGTRPAIALCANDFGSGQRQSGPQELRQRQECVGTRHLMQPAINKQRDVIAQSKTSARTNSPQIVSIAESAEWGGEKQRGMFFVAPS